MSSEPTRIPLLSGPKRQHYLPRFYLEGFCRNSLACVFDRLRNDFRLQTPENTGVEGHLYTFEDSHGRQRFEVEAQLSRVEGDAATAIRKVLAKQPITPEERADLAIFAAMAHVRTPEMLGYVSEIEENVIQAMMRSMFGSAAQINESLIQTQADGKKEFSLSAEQLADMVNSGAIRATISKSRQLSNMFHMLAPIVEILDRATWVVLHRSDEAASFVTSDAPILLLPPREYPRGGLYGVGFGIRGLEVRLPLSNAACLSMINLDMPPSLTHRDISRNEIRNMNLATTENAHHWVIGRDEALVRNLVTRTGIDQMPVHKRLHSS